MPSQDVVLGLYYMTRERVNAKGRACVSRISQKCIARFDAGQVHLQARVKVRSNE